MTTANANLANAKFGKHEFGIATKQEIAKILHCLANEIEAGDIIVTSATSYRIAKKNEFPISCIMLKFNETLGELGEKSLYGDNMFPVDIAIAK